MKWEMKRKKEKKHAKKKIKKIKKKVGNEKLGENFCGKKNKSGGKACPIEFFFFFFFDKAM